MSTLKGGPGIVNDDSLVLYLDALNTKSYNGTNRWLDMSKSLNNATLVNGATFSNSGISFDGINDYVVTDSRKDVGNRFTVNAWVKFNVLGTNVGGLKRGAIMSNSYNYTANKGFLFIGSANSGSDLFISLGMDQKVAVSNTGYITTSKVYMLTATANATDDLLRLYVDGVEVSYLVQANADITLSYDVASLYIGTYFTGDYTNGTIYNVQLYNRALTPSEILQNYNAHKSRFL
jgi:hypothetical protein